MRKISKIIVHCSDSPDDLDIGFKQINDWHKQNGWLSPSGISCGYHYIVRRDGRVQRGRPDEEMGAHTKGHNANSIGICWIGRKSPSEEQRKALYVLINGIRADLNISIDKVYGHCEFDRFKTCPNLDMDKVRAELVFTNITIEPSLSLWGKIRRFVCRV
jgi:N-acetylmuramoyl-L-alanine amidase